MITMMTIIMATIRKSVPMIKKTMGYGDVAIIDPEKKAKFIFLF
jgi:hypothetical protein